MRLASQVLFRQPLNVEIEFMEYQETLEEDIPIAYALSPKWFAGRIGSGQLFMYPQPLVKQLEISFQVEFVPIDIKIQLNSKVKWNLGQAEISDSVDLELTVIHELIHGLGFATNLVNYKPNYDQSMSYLVTRLRETHAKMLYFELPTIFTSLLLGKSSEFRELASKIATFPIKNTTPSEYLQLFESTEEFISAARKLFADSTSGSVKIPGITEFVHIYSPATFKTSSSLSHLNISYSSSPEFIMTPNVEKGDTLADKIALRNAIIRSLHLSTRYRLLTSAPLSIP